MFGAMRDRVGSFVGTLAAARNAHADFDEKTRATVRMVREFTMTSPERLFAACEAIRYATRCDIAGSIVECGVWRGGSMMAMLRTLMECGDTSREIYLYDTFSGMPAPSAHDKSFRGESAQAVLDRENPDVAASAWCKASIADVRQNVASVGYPEARINYVEGPVEETIPGTLPDRIAVLRLDTDWYSSTLHELVHLYPKLESGGVLIIDDYGHWTGAREAVDSFVEQNHLKLLLTRTDYTGRLAVKP